MGNRILVVDDEQSLLLTLVANLELEGFDVVDAANGAQALALLEREPFDLVLSDIRMPGMDGVELYRRIRARGDDVPVILMTAFALEGLVHDAIGHGAYAVLSKPFDVDHLVAALAAAARKPVVLVVDDDVRVADSTAGALDAAGVRARAVYSGRDAIAAIGQGKVDVCVVDMVMPELTGPEVIERIRSLDDAVACIAITGHDVPALFQRAAPQVFAFVRKPVAPADLIWIIARARGRPRAAPRR